MTVQRKYKEWKKRSVWNTHSDEFRNHKIGVIQTNLVVSKGDTETLRVC